MPTNLPPQYFDVEKKLKITNDPHEKITIMEELLSIIPKHKGTEKLQALYKTKIAKLKSKIEKKPTKAKHAASFHINSAGAGQVILIGPPNCGKSTLIRSLTNATPEIGDYPFTTHAALPAMLKYKDIQIQLIDIPPVTPDYFEYWQAEIIKNADAALIIVDLGKPNGALDFLGLLEKLKEKNIEIIPEKKKVLNDNVNIKKRALILANKSDLPYAENNLKSLKEVLEPGFEVILISTARMDSLQELKNRIFLLLDVLRVHSKTPGKKASLDEPYVFKKGSTLLDMAKSVHRDFANKLQFARLWNKNQYNGQKINRDYILQDGDIIELHL